jgi:hypothetical protein
MARATRTMVAAIAVALALAAAANARAEGAEGPPPQPQPQLQTTGTGLIVIPTGSSGKPEWRSEAQPAEKRPAQPKPDLHPLGVFGLSAGVQAAGAAMTLLVAGLDYGLSDSSIEIGYAVMLGITPIADGVLGWLVMQKSTRYDAPLFSTLIGAYLGAAVAYVGVYFFQEADDPKVDGKYDDIYFHGDGVNNRSGVGSLALFIAPVLLPAMGAGLGALIGRRPLEKQEAVTLAPYPRGIGVSGTF